MKTRKPNRLKGFDYTQDNLYFVTSCVYKMVCCFGDVVGTDRDLSCNNLPRTDPSGTNVSGNDLSINNANNINPNRDLPGNDENNITEPRMVLNESGKIADRQWHWLGEQYPYIVLHEFIVMPNHVHGIIEIKRHVGAGRVLPDWYRTGRDLSVQFPKIKSLSEIMGAYKMTVSKQIHLAGYADFSWQRSFHDHIIRDQKSYERISNYIIKNPKTWYDDKFFRGGL